jgi:hypothetical protein
VIISLKENSFFEDPIISGPQLKQINRYIHTNNLLGKKGALSTKHINNISKILNQNSKSHMLPWVRSKSYSLLSSLKFGLFFRISNNLEKLFLPNTIKSFLFAEVLKGLFQSHPLGDHNKRLTRLLTFILSQRNELAINRSWCRGLDLNQHDR